MSRTSSLSNGGLFIANKSAIAAATANIFTISSGDAFSPAVEIIGIIGIVASTIQSQTNNTKLVHSLQSDLCAVLDINGDATGTQFTTTGVTTDALINSGLSGMPAAKQILFNGTISMNCSASSSGTISWKVIYRKLQPDATIVAA